MGAEGRPTYYDENSSEDSDAESASESEAELDDSNSESNASSEEENVASRTGKPRTSAAQSSGVPRDVRVKILAQELVDVGSLLLVSHYSELIVVSTVWSASLIDT